MNSDITIDAVRLALSMNEIRARTAGANIANASRPGASAARVDFAGTQSLLAEISQAQNPEALGAGLQRALVEAAEQPQFDSGQTIQIDAEVGEMVAASAGYQSLTEAVSRYFGLLRLSIAGRV